MKLDSETPLDQFREEMQHRVVKYPLNSRPVKEALRFAKTHEDPAFYRIASDKIHAQRQFQRELYGPGKVERLVDFFTLGSLREVVVTLVLVSAGVMGLETGKKLLAPPDHQLYEQMNIEELASALGVALDVGSMTNVGLQQATAIGDATPELLQSTSEPQSAQLGDADVARIADAIMQKLMESGQWPGLSPIFQPTKKPASNTPQIEAAAEESPADSQELITEQQQVAVVAESRP